MKKVTLECFKNFRCTADACKDNCCIGWEIDIDEDTMAFYDTFSGDMADRLKRGISKEGTPHFITDENDRCPFLNCNNLCDIIINLGEDKIPYICRNHPRFYTWLDTRVEMGIGLCCPEGAKLLLSSPKSLVTHIPYDSDDSTEAVATFARDVAFSIIQDRSYSIATRLCAFLDFCESMDEFLFFDDINGVRNVADTFKINPHPEYVCATDIDEILELYKGLIPINSDWTNLMESLTENSRDILSKKGILPAENRDYLYMYEHLGVYFIYRHFINGFKDGDILSAGNLIVLSIIFCGICSGLTQLLKNDVSIQEISSLYSKQVEYSQDNTDAVSYSEISNIKGLIHLIFG